MAKYNVELTGLFNVSKGPRNGDWKATVSADWEKVPEPLWPLLCQHGLKQLLADSASGATSEVEASAAMHKKLDSLYLGDWTARAAGEGLSDTRSLAVYRLYVATMDADTKKRFNKAFDSQSAKVRKALESTSFDDETIAAEIAKIEAERKAKTDEDAARKAIVAKLADKVVIDF